jgi:hypothetical protein
VRDLQVPLEREYTCWTWHLEYQVCSGAPP